MAHLNSTRPKSGDLANPAASRYASAVALYAQDLERVEREINANFHSDVALIPKVSAYLAGGGGKRIRPLLVIASSRLCGYTGAIRQITHSVVAEYIHAATLLHDDVVDEAELRRGAQSANMKFGNEASVLVGDFLFAKSFQLMSDDGDIRIIQTVAEATRNLAEGEVLQLVNTMNLEITEDIYLDTIYRKTGALIEACCRIGAILGGSPTEREEALAGYGRDIGMAFQLVDDALDYAGEKSAWGKPIGADLAEGKVTMPLIRAIQMAGDAEREDIASLMESDEELGPRLDRIMMILKKYDTISTTLEMARGYAASARERLISAFEPSIHLTSLLDVADYIVERKV
ncbi:MAG: polyprenyl synthetase family protein [Nitrospinae bacterium]|nr:polyprenyl synthetase family protein [Nitrospinota bacterium]